MSKTWIKGSCLIITLAIVLSGTCLGQEIPPTELEAGIGVVITAKPYVGVDAEAYIIPFINYTQGQFFVRGPSVGYRFIQTDSFALDAIGKWRFDGYDEDDSRDLEGMSDRHMTVDGGAAVSLFGDWGTLKLTALTDMLSEHDGQEITLAYSKEFTQDKITITPSIGLSWQSSNLLDYYYGVEANEARAGRAAYDAGSDLAWYIGLGGEYKLDEKWTAMAGVVYEKHGSEITDSPIVEDNYSLGIFTGLTYKF